MNSLFTRIGLLIAFISVSFGVNAQTISSNLNARPGVTVGVQEDFIVTLSAGALSPLTNVKLAIQLVNPAQSVDIALSLQNPQTTQYENLVFDGSGSSISVAAPFFLNPNPLNLRATFSTAGVYNYSVSILDGTTNAVIATSNESVTVGALALVAPTISSTLPTFSPAITGTTVNYSVSTVPNDYAGTQVRVFFKLSNPAQVSNLTLQYEATPGNFQTLPINGAGEGFFGPVSGFPLTNTSSNFKATASAAGTYTYKMSLYDVSNGDTLATATESIVVVDPVAPTIFSTLDGELVDTGVETAYQVTTTTGTVGGTLVKGFFKLTDVAQTADVNISYETAPGVFTALPLNPNGTVSFGPGTGFPLANTSTNFKVTFDAAGVYGYKLFIYEVATDDTLATATESVTVEDPAPVAPGISSDLDERAGVVVNIEEAFTITTVANDFADEDVRIKITLETPAQAPNFFITYNSATLTFDANGVAYIGAAAGFPLDDEDFDLNVTFLAGGTFAYNIALINVSDDSVLAENDEEVFVLDNSSIAENASFISNTFPNPTEGIVHIQTSETGVGTLGVYSVTGKKVINQTINGSLNTVSLEALPAGIYIIKISQNEKDAVIRVVKK
jgi:plastocyanin